MKQYAAPDILLESGTNEMEILEFYLEGQSYGINVQKLREIMCFDPAMLTPMPESLPSVLGVYMVRGTSLPLVDLTSHLRRRPAVAPGSESRAIVLVCQFNRKVTGFLVDGVNQIHRINWQHVEPMAPLIEKFKPRFTGTIHVEDREVLIVDLEHIVAEVDPEMNMTFEHESDKCSGSEGLQVREDVGLMLAEDSVIIRLGIQKVMNSAGYGRLKTFPDGEECYRELKRIKEQVNTEAEFLSHVRLLITDIEMPRMDGLTLCRRIREELGLKDLKVILFSSLITDQMAHKCKSVGADTWISKPQISELVELVDTYCLPAGADGQK
ncbi:response receiver scaffold protein CheV [Syntrophotalea carbinolica DSM 2380]|uniref:Response receiver scaffold protein CheV n=1 Tax=Syntrophotalea carbinolica (strain DSM 2380 / NBRC 103641 / GraBd1) TaxID=338963 RepID=Q3A2X1_SYNC1|nr:chemotaxis protein [Syntrophotalea carbinolica]ABA89286.1 response receiver scaffold protein CheV [Syntrophotalea carbinolica DSM 2380]